MPKIPILRAKTFYKSLLHYGCVAVSVRGSHHKVQNPITSKISVITIHAGKDFGRGAFSSVLSQLGIDINDFLRFLDEN